MPGWVLPLALGLVGWWIAGWVIFTALHAINTYQMVRRGLAEARRRCSYCDEYGVTPGSYRRVCSDHRTSVGGSDIEVWISVAAIFTPFGIIQLAWIALKFVLRQISAPGVALQAMIERRVTTWAQTQREAEVAAQQVAERLAKGELPMTVLYEDTTP